MQWFPKLKLRDFLIILAITAVYFASRLYHLNSLPIFVDEAIYSRWAQIALHDASWRFISLTDGKQPLFIWASMPFLYFIKDQLIATRLVSVFCGYLTIVGLWYAGFLLKDKRAGYLTAALGVITPFLFFYDRFAVMESMLSASGIWVFILAYILAKTRRLDVAMILGITGGLAFLVKSPAQVFLILIPAAYLFLAEDKTRFSKSNVIKYLGLLLVVFVLAELINNIQRLSPWMYMITRKTGDFVISPLAMIRDYPTRILQNFMDTQRWLIAYLTLPIYGLAIIGAIKMLRNLPKFLLVSAWVWTPMMALVATALLYRPRYLVFITPFILLYAVHAFPIKTKHRLLVLLALSILPIKFMWGAYFNPLTMPLIKADQDYLSGWASGNGVKEIAGYLAERATHGSEIIVGTEGTFGLLPHGLELYTNSIPNIRITGYYPVTLIPPAEVVAQIGAGREVYFVLNNTQVTETPKGLTEVAAYKKADNSWIRLYRLLESK